MVTFLLRALIFLVSAALGLLVANWLLADFTIVWENWWGFALCAVIFAILQSVLAPWILKVTRRRAPALVGGIGILSTLVALIIVVLLPFPGLRITSFVGWVLGAVIVWLVTALATLLLPMLVFKKAAAERRSAAD